MLKSSQRVAVQGWLVVQGWFKVGCNLKSSQRVADEMDAPDPASMRQTDVDTIQLHRSVRYEN